MAKEDRKGRRINYSRKELAEYLHCAETSVDYRLKKISDYYDKHKRRVPRHRYHVKSITI